MVVGGFCKLSWLSPRGAWQLCEYVSCTYVTWRYIVGRSFCEFCDKLERETWNTLHRRNEANSSNNSNFSIIYICFSSYYIVNGVCCTARRHSAQATYIVCMDSQCTYVHNRIVDSLNKCFMFYIHGNTRMWPVTVSTFAMHSLIFGMRRRFCRLCRAFAYQPCQYFNWPTHGIQFGIKVRQPRLIYNFFFVELKFTITIQSAVVQQPKIDFNNKTNSYNATIIK